MIKMRKKFNIIVLLILIVSFTGCNDMKYNNSENKIDLITKKYSTEQIEKLELTTGSEKVTFSEFKKDFDAQCIRKTHQGYYVILLLEGGENSFVFFNDDNILTSVMTVDKFKTQNEFNIQALDGMTKSAVLNFDPNAILIPVSSVEITAHIVQEGLYIIKYTRFLDGQSIEDPVVNSVEFIANENISTSSDALVKDEIPFIFEFDKVSE